MNSYMRTICTFREKGRDSWVICTRRTVRCKDSVNVNLNSKNYLTQIPNLISMGTNQ